MTNNYTKNDLQAELGCDKYTLEKFLSMVESEFLIEPTATYTERQFQRLLNYWWRSGAEDNFPRFRSKKAQYP